MVGGGIIIPRRFPMVHGTPLITATRQTVSEIQRDQFCYEETQ